MIVSFAQAKEHVAQYGIADRQKRMAAEDALWSWARAHMDSVSCHESLTDIGVSHKQPPSWADILGYFETYEIPKFKFQGFAFDDYLARVWAGKRNLGESPKETAQSSAA